MNSMDGFENEDIEAAIKEAACIAFTGIHFEGLYPLVV
jgi:hypothetical protein